MDKSPFSILPLEITKDSIQQTVSFLVSSLHHHNKLILFYGATGVGKTTTLPFQLANQLGSITVLVDSPALKNSLSRYMHKATDVHYITKLEYIISPVPGFILVDESHSPDHLTQHIINRLAKPQHFFLTSATSGALSANPESTKFPIVEKYDPRYTLPALHSAQPLPFLNSTSGTLRTCVFLPNDRDAIDISRKYSGVPVFAVTSDNYERVLPLINNTKGGCLIFASPVMQTGVTIELDVVIDLGLSNSVSFNKTGDTGHINIQRVNSTFHERMQRRGRVGRLRRGLYVNANTSYSKDFLIHPYCLELYKRLGKPINKKLIVQLLSPFHPFVTDDLVDESGNIVSYWNHPYLSGRNAPKTISHPTVDNGRLHAHWWDHTVPAEDVWEQLITKN